MGLIGNRLLFFVMLFPMAFFGQGFTNELTNDCHEVTKSQNVPPETLNSPFSILNSEKSILHSQFSILNTEELFSKKRFFQADTVFNKKRFWGLTGFIATGYVGTTLWFNQIWYAQYPRSGFHFFNDFGEWLEMDKIGHGVTANSEAKYAHKLYRWTGLPQKKAIWAGAITSIVLQSTIEVLDGFSTEWGASPGDILFNTAGTALYSGQMLLWNEERITLKYSWHTVKHSSTPIESYDHPGIFTNNYVRSKELYGTFLPERILKDYNGTTVWASVNIYSFLKKESKFPKWLNIAVGYGVENLYGASDNEWTKDGATFRADPLLHPRYGQWFLAPDIDLTRIPVKKRGWKILLEALNLLKIPTPTLELTTRGQVRGHFIYF